MTDAERLAEHEAAHAAAALALDARVLSVDAVGDERHAGMVRAVYPDTPEGARTRMQVILAGLIQTADAPAWPPQTDRSTDERNLRELADRLQLDEGGYRSIVEDTLELTTSRPYGLLRTTLAHALEQYGRLDDRYISAIKAITEGARMERMLLKATTTATRERGEFEAVISTATIDRERDVVVPAAMVAALRKWTTTGKRVPLAWGHSTLPEDQIGHVDPASVRASGDEVIASGWIDQSTERGAHAWRLVKSGTLGFSFGYLIIDAVKRADGVREIRALDVFEVTATTVPMNGETRVLGWKALGDYFDYDAVRAEWRGIMTRTLATGAGRDLLREKSARLEREVAPISIAVFEC